MLKYGTAALLLVLFAVSAVRAADTPAAPDQTKTVRVLTVGNSFAENAITYLRQIGKSAGVTFVIGTANIGGCPLEKHWKLADLAQKNPDDPAARYGDPKNPKSAPLKTKLTQDKWDFVTIQQYSLISHNAATYQPFADNLAKLIRETAPQAKLMIHETWAYRVDDPRFTGGAKAGEPKTQQEMYEAVRKNYYDLAAHLKADLLPSGDAFYAVDTDPKWGYKPDPAFDPKTAVEPALPDQKHSVHAGYRWSKGKDGQVKLGMDGHHAGKAGNYLAGLIWFEKMSGVSAEQVTFVPEGIDAEFAAFLRKTAHETIQKQGAAEAK